MPKLTTFTNPSDLLPQTLRHVGVASGHVLSVPVFQAKRARVRVDAPGVSIAGRASSGERVSIKAEEDADESVLATVPAGLELLFVSHDADGPREVVVELMVD